MFYVTSKDRIISVIIAFSTVIILFLFAAVIKTEDKKTTQTSTNIEKKIQITDTDELWENKMIDNDVNTINE